MIVCEKWKYNKLPNETHNDFKGFQSEGASKLARSHTLRRYVRSNFASSANRINSQNRESNSTTIQKAMTIGQSPFHGFATNALTG